MGNCPLLAPRSMRTNSPGADYNAPWGGRSLAHELGHLVMDCRGVKSKEEEKLAHRFAAAFIVPAAVARRELGPRRRSLNLAELALLKGKHGLSMQGWARRASASAQTVCIMN